ncbi:MAG: hypothetical protein GY702_02995 [Desulfobulbaceae bacterium]|nr:hypothetical protein [Desulfobulbaceae bacterium]
MNPRKRVLLLVVIMASVVFVIEAVTIYILYNTAFEEEKARLEVAAKSQARLIEAIARFDRVYSNDYPYGARRATLNQIRNAHSKYRGFGETGEFTLSTKENDQIVFLLSHRHHDLNNPKPVQWKSKLAEPMRRALSGKSGTIIGYDYRGVKVLAAHEPVTELNLGIVAKIDLSEIRAPFIKAAFISGLFAMTIIGIGVSLFFKITNPILKKLNDTVEKLQKTLEEVKILRGILPICSFCKKIRDDAGNWNQVEVYVQDRSEADFSHSICPVCLKKHYPKEHEAIESKKADGGTTNQSS